MIDVYAVRVERIVKKAIVSKKGPIFNHERKTNSYLCMINVFADNPVIMYTDDLRSAIYYSKEELKYVIRYLLANKITFVVTDVNEKPAVFANTEVKKKRSSLLEFV